ncbi:hypothetical protein KAH37_02050 [bacterium]|nr:hypothetical protein [bacterium]
MKKIAFLLFLLFAFTVSAKKLGSEVAEYSGKKLQWDASQHSYFVMFKSLLKNEDTTGDSVVNPQADHCIDESVGSTYHLNGRHIPQDAHIKRAFLVWTGAVSQEDLAGVLDNDVTLEFSSKDGYYSLSKEVEVVAKTLSSAQGFSFESYRFPDDPDEAYFTYRTDITDFFTDIHREGEKKGVALSGLQLLGDYNLKNFRCAEDVKYVRRSTMVSGWSIILIYDSDEVLPNKIYMYNGFSGYSHVQTEMSVTGFILPESPRIRLTLASFEGDPGRAVLTNPDGGPAFPEGVLVQGGLPDWLPLSNECNPPAEIQDATGLFPYVEVFNSISSQYGFSDTDPSCIGGTPPGYNNMMEYGVDMDTFVIDTMKQDDFAGHFYQGGDTINIKISANQDWMLTNFLIVAVSSGEPVFDIPNEPEMFVCNHYTGDDYRWCDESEEFWFSIKVQNWSNDPVSNVVVRNRLDTSIMEYIPGTTSYAVTFDEKWGVIERDWIHVPDNGVFPLEDGVTLDALPTMRPCNEDESWDEVSPITPDICPDTALVRFKVKLRHIYVLDSVFNIATIKADGMSDSYDTNGGIPLWMPSSFGDKCTRTIDMTLCGGSIPSILCQKDGDCPAGKECSEEAGRCVNIENATPTEGVIVTVSKGESPSVATENIPILVPQKVANLVIGSLLFNQTVARDTFYKFKQLKLGVTSSSSNVFFTIRLIEDLNNNGSFDSLEPEVVKGGGIPVATLSNDYNYSIFGGLKHAFLIVADVNYIDVSPDEVSTYFLSLMDPFSIELVDDGVPIVQLVNKNGDKVNRIDFPTFMVEPSDGFIITKGMNDPSILDPNDINGRHALMQLRLKSNKQNSVLQTLRIGVNEGSTRLGAGIASLSIYEDVNGDGVLSDEEPLLAEVSEFTEQTVDFNLDYPLVADKDSYLLVVGELALSCGETAQLRINQNSLQLSHVMAVYQLPLVSKQFVDRRDICSASPQNSSCECTITTVEKPPKTYAFLLFLLIFPLVGLFVRRKR